MTPGQYRVIADRDKGDDPQWTDLHVGDRYIGIATERAYEDDPLVRIERPVPTSRCMWPECPGFPRDVPMHEIESGPELHEACKEAAQPFPHPPTREQIAEAWDRAREDRSIPRKRNGGMRPVDAFEAGLRSAFALIQNGADR